ncbi:hypothetical protein ACFVW9_15220 [Streptomyces sp. NPDC058217]|uniref:hypothetical protein n=1 Tax=Streptomyces sp. NPDC058217 TaxID=3346384 RepID=UPI0036E9F4B4
MIDAQKSWPCELCLRPSVPRVHEGCVERVRHNLRTLPGLYRELGDALVPGRRGGGGRSGTRTAPLPCNIDALDLRARGGIEGILATWAADLCDREGWTLTEYGTVEVAVAGYAELLLMNLQMICDEHPAVKELADELRQIVGEAQRIITGEKPPRTIPVACPCGQILRITLDTAGARCPGCGEQYGHSELMDLPLSGRPIAA